MTTTIYGNPATYTLGQATGPEVVFPVNGEPVDAATVATATVQGVADYIATTADALLQQQTFGIEKIVSHGTVGSLKARTGMTDGDVVMLLDPTYTGGGSGLLNGFGLFVFYTGATWPQTTHYDGVGNGWIVIEPNDGTGRWINLAAGVGWYLGTDPLFSPKPLPRSKHWSSVGTVNSSVDYIGIVSTNIGTEVLLGTSLATSSVIHLDFDFSVASPTMGTSGLGAVIEVSAGGGTWTLIPGTKKPIGGGGGTGVNDEWIPVHLGIAYTAASNNTYDFRVSLSGDTAQTMTLFRTWSARGISYSAT